MIEITSFTARHAQSVADLILDVQRGEFDISITLDDQPDLKKIPEFYQSGTGGFWVALDDDRVVGTIGLRDIGDGHGALRKMFVAADRRGREHGVAQRLLETLL